LCGIVGILGRERSRTNSSMRLKRLEYRGYDSAGVATLGTWSTHAPRAKASCANLEQRLTTKPLSGTSGLDTPAGRPTGRPTENNAHRMQRNSLPSCTTGHIENFRELREELEKKGPVSVARPIPKS